MNALVWAGFNEWLLGYPDRALRYIDNARSLARRLNKPFALAYAGIRVWTEGFCGDFIRARAASGEVERLSAELGFPVFSHTSEILAAWARAHLGEMSDAIDSIRARLAEMDAINLSAMRGPYLVLLGVTQAIAGVIDDAIVTVGQALVTNPDESWCRPLMFPLRGEHRLRTDTARDAARLELAERDFREAIAVAQRMSAKSSELRANISLARLLATQGHLDEACAMLAEIYGWFTEGFGTADLKEAKALLDQLNS